MKKKTIEVNTRTKPQLTLMEFINFLLINGLLAWIITLAANLSIFLITLFWSEKSLLYSLIFFAISIAGQILFLKKK